MRRRVICLLTVFVMLAGAFALAEEVKMRSAETNPAAEGRVKFNHDRNGNTLFDIKVAHLARPDRLTPAKSDYVVWVQRPGEGPQNLGVLKVNENLQGSFHGTTPYQKFDVFVTAEDNPKADTPSSSEVLRGIVAHD